MGLREGDQLRTNGKAMSFRAQGRVQPYPASRRPGACAIGTSVVCLWFFVHRAFRAQRKEDIMNYNDTTSLIAALAGLVAALARLVSAFRRLPRRAERRSRATGKARRGRR